MKKFFSILIILSSLSCEKANDDFSKTEDRSNSLTSYMPFVQVEKIEAFNSLSLAEKKIAYGSLSKYDKFYFWLNRSEEYLSSDKLTDSQKSAIQEILSNAVSPEIFINSSQESKDFKDYIVRWEQKYKEIFSDRDAVEFAVLRKEKGVSGLRIQAEDCDCANNSLIISDCGSDEICLIPPSPGCETTTEQEEGGGGCGLWWLMPCDMLCK